jgi:hypothetical protein
MEEMRLDLGLEEEMEFMWNVKKKSFTNQEGMKMLSKAINVPKLGFPKIIQNLLSRNVSRVKGRNKHTGMQ